VPRSSVALGKILGGATQALMQGVILLVLMFFPFMYGFSFDTLCKALALLPLALLLALGLTSIGVAIAANMKSMEGFPMVMNLFLLPLFFLSGAMFPLQGLPSWMNFLTKITPLSYGVDMLKGVNIGGGTSILSKIPKQALAQMSPQLKASLLKASPQMKLVIQRYPLWLDLVVVTGFGVVMLFIAIWQFGRQE
jgi:ABC-2 type transport system permease protein